MPIPERDPTYTTSTYADAYGETRRERRHLLGEQAVTSFTFLPEAETVYGYERDYLMSRVIGQQQAIDALIVALDRSESRPISDTRPMANLAFLGPTGVGKTETAKALSEILNNRDPNLVRIDCSNFSLGHEIASLIGSPPGYVGREQEPILHPRRIEEPGTVLLFDEIEKGSSKLHNLLLQIMDNGQLELNDGNIVSFRDVIVIMTSNLGAAEMVKEASGSRTGFSTGTETRVDKDALEAVALKSFKDFFRPEFVNRLDDMIVYHPLDEPSLHEVLEVKLKVLNRNYIDEHGAFISLSDATRDYLVEHAIAERTLGVRPLVRAIDKNIVANFGRYASSDKIEEGTEVMVYHRNELPEDMVRGYTGNLLFATRPDDTVRKKVIVDPPSLDPTFTAATSTQLVPLPKPPLAP